MPIIKSAKKALRQNRKRAAANLKKKLILKKEIKLAREKKDPKILPRVYSLIDKAVKRRIIHKNKAARIKSQIAKLAAK